MESVVQEMVDLIKGFTYSWPAPPYCTLILLFIVSAMDRQQDSIPLVSSHFILFSILCSMDLIMFLLS